MYNLKLFKVVLIFCSIFVLIGCISYVSSSKIDKIDPISERLSPLAFSNISHSKEVELFEMAPPFQNGIGKLGQYQIKLEGKKVDFASLEKIKEIILNFDHYRFEPIKKCLFVPQKGLKFSRDGSEVLVFVSFTCKQIKIQFHDDSLTADFDSGIEELEEVLNSIEKINKGEKNV